MEYLDNRDFLCQNKAPINLNNILFSKENSCFNVNTWTVCIIKDITKANNGIAATMLLFISCDKNINNTVAIVTKNNVNKLVKSNINILFSPFSLAMFIYYH